MCGINGFWGPRDRELLEAMAVAQAHRGPDDVGFFEHEQASLGFRRLSIIDVEHGAQPMSTDDGLLTMVYNGEVYNFREMRVELEAAGHAFHTNCDTEVVLHAYAQWGTDCFHRFNGMWGLAILDLRDKPKLVLARDHFGIKPLYYAQWSGRTYFASEIKSILQDRSFPREVDDQAMYEYLRWSLFDHSERTFFAGIHRVGAGCFAIVDDKGLTETTYWTPRLHENSSPDPAEFRKVFERAVERRLVSDVPVGICLSGGLDSSSICGVMSKQLAEHVPDAKSLGKTLKTFSAVFPNDPIDESKYIDAVINKTHASNTQCEPKAEDFIEQMEPWVWHIEEPMVSSAPFAMWMVMALASNDVTVVLDGQGGDELLGGYDHYPYVYLRQLLAEKRYGAFVREAWKLRDIVWPLAKRRLRDRNAKRAERVTDWLNPAFTKGKKDPVDDRSPNNLKKRLLQDFLTWSLPPLLRYEDRASMAHSIEARLPFLDQELVDYILGLPTDALISDGWTRRILRDALKDVLPDIVQKRRKKIGFTTPEFRWYRRERAALQSLMRSPSFNSRKYWNGPAVSDAFRRACSGEISESMFFWRAINAEIWLRVFIDDAEVAIDRTAKAGYARRGDVAFAGNDPELAALAAASAPNRGHHIFLSARGETVARIPMHSRLIGAGDSLTDALLESLATLKGRGVAVADGDIIICSEKALSISQRRAFPVDEIKIGAVAKILSRFVTKVPTGIGLGHPATMQLAINEVGLRKIVLAAVAAAVTRPFGKHGVFYDITGRRAKAIDGPSKHNLPPYDKWASMAPDDCEGEVRRIAAAVGERFGCHVEVAIIDVNDLSGEVFATTSGVTSEAILAMTIDNPLGQSDQQTPFGLIRRVATGQSAAKRELAHV